MALAVIGIVLLGGCIDTESKNKNIVDTLDNNTNINHSNTILNSTNTSSKTEQINNIMNKISNATIDTTANTTTAINNTNNNIDSNIANTVKNTANTANTKTTTNTTNTSTSTNTSETSVQTTIMKTTIKNVNVKETHRLTDENSDSENFVIIDIRTLLEFNSRHIKDAINIDYYDNDFVERSNDLNKSKTYFIYCRSRSRSGSSMQNFQQLKFEVVYNMLRDVNSWRSDGFPVE
ncbi:MAG: rhodanese-like domain-containing protein [Candidatus Altarchaeum sp.]|nr:rhodanese-like domain-containing protein [Candidatus Altarchaeum sp.]